MILDNFYLDYLHQKYLHFKGLAQKPKPKEPGPVVTISRQAGCGGSYIARMLCEQLNEYYLPVGEETRWNVISKQIINDAARILNTEPENIKFVFDAEERSFLDDFVQSLTDSDYVCENEIREAIRQAVREIAIQGHAIILGRGGAQLTRDIARSLHVRLVAPRRWRIDEFAKRHNISEAAAVRKVDRIDRVRERLNEMLYAGSDPNSCYDVTFCRERFTSEEIVSAIIHLMQLKKLV